MSINPYGAFYYPPTENLPNFDVLVFRNAQDVVSYSINSGTASKINIQSDNSASTVYPTFVSSTGSQDVYIDNSITPLSYVPSTSTLSCDNFSGTASNAINATNVTVTNNNSGTVMYPIFTTSGAGQKSLLFDSTTTTTLTYAPISGQLTTEILTARTNSTINNCALGSQNSNSIYMGVNTRPLPLRNLSTGDFNVGIGYCLTSLSSGSNNFAMGINCGLNLKSGSNNCLMGHRAGLALGFSSTTEIGNVAVGDTALTNADSVNYVTGVGADTGLSVINGNLFCTMIGGRADCVNGGQYNTSIGSWANATGSSYSTAIGAYSVCTTPNTVQLGRSTDNVNCPNTVSIASNLIMTNATNAIIETTGNANLTLSSVGTGSLILKTQTNIRLSISALGIATFSVPPECSITPTTANMLTNKTYVDSLIGNLNITTDNTSTIHYITLVTGTGSGVPVHIDNSVTPLSYIPSTSTLSCDNFSGTASNATNATNAVNITVADNNSTTTMYPVFTTSGAGSKSLLFDSTATTLTYIPSTGKLTTEILTTRANSSINNCAIGSNNISNIYFGVNDTSLPFENITTGDYNVALGYSLIELTSGSNNLAVGIDCGISLVNGSNNCLIGNRAGVNLGFSSTSEFGNTTVGDSALTNADSVNYCTGVGKDTGDSIYNGNLFCTMIGARADCVDGSEYNTSIGGWSSATGSSYSTAIGAYSVCNTSNTVQLGRDVDNVNCPNTVSIGNHLIMSSSTDGNRQIMNTYYNIHENDATPGGTYRGRIYTTSNTCFLELNTLHNFNINIGLTNVFTIDSSYATFQNPPQCSVLPTTSNELTNKTYVDSLIGNLNITTDNTATVHYPVMVTGTGSGLPCHIDNSITPLSYIPSTSTLSCDNFSGTASNATNAVNVNLSNTATGTTNYLVMSTTSSGNSALLTDPAGATYDSTSNTADMSILGNAATASNATNAVNVNLSNTATGTTNYLIMSATSSGNSALLTDTSGATYDSTSNTADINISGTTAKVTIADDNSATTMYPIFTTSGAGQKTLLFDSLTTPLSYIPSTGELSTQLLNVRDVATFNPSSGTTLTADLTGSATTPKPVLAIQDFTGGVVNNVIYFLPTGPSTASNQMIQVNDAVIVTRNLTSGVSPPLFLGVGGTTSSGLRLQQTQIDIGVGGSTNNPTTRLVITAADIRTTATMPVSTDNSTVVPSTAWVQGALTSSLSNYVTLTTTQTSITGQKSFTNTSNIYYGNGSNLTSVDASTISTTSLASTGTFYLPYLSSSTGTSGQTVYTDGNLSFDRTNNNLIVPNISPYGQITMTNATPTITTVLNNSITLATASTATTAFLNFQTSGLTRMTIAPGGATRFYQFIALNDTTSTNRQIINTFYNLHDTDATSGGTYRGRIYTTSNTCFVELNASHIYKINIGGVNLFEVNPTAAYFSYNNIFLSAGLFNIGTGAGSVSNTIIGYNTPNTVVFTTGSNTIYGNSAGSALGISASSNTLVGSSAGISVTSGSSNTLVGSSAGSNLTVGNNNICIGTNTTLPLPAGSNQTVIGDGLSKMLIQGAFCFKYGGQLTNASYNLPLAGTQLAQLYLVQYSTAGFTITLPNPGDYVGQTVTFKRIATAAATFTFATAIGVGAAFVPINAITTPATILVATNTFQVTMMSSGSRWLIISQA